MPDAIEAVFFDFGGTLFSYRRMDRPQVELLLRAVERLGVEADVAAAIRAYRERADYDQGEHAPAETHRSTA